MSEQLKIIASRIKDLREIAGVSIESLAVELNITGEILKSYENGELDIPVSFLFELAQKFGVDLTELLTGEAPKLSEYCLIRNGRGVSVERRKQYKYQHLAFNFVHKSIEPFLVTVEPQAEQGDLSFNSHKGQEFNYVLEGRLMVILNGHELILETGDSLYFNSDSKHAMKALDGKAAKFLVIVI